METKLKVRLEAWDDPAFHAAFEDAREEVVTEGIPLDTQDAAMRAQHLLAAAGYPDVHIDVERSVDEALRHVVHWTVHRVPAD
jgi:hypothetical protein